MSANSNIVVAGLGLDAIRSNLRGFLAARPEFVDFDFDDSAIGLLLDLLAYTTHLNAFYANMAANESFIDTAQLYDSVISHARRLGYRPRSAVGATANLSVRFTSAAANNTFTSITVARGTEFRASVNGSSYTFSTTRAQTLAANSSGGFAGHLAVAEGIPLTHRFLYSRSGNTAFVLPNANADVTGLQVSVSSSGGTDVYLEATDILAVNSSSKVYYLEADRASRFRVGFGDGVLGQRPPDNSLVDVSYRVCSAGRPNGANSFSAVSTVGGRTDFVLGVAERAAGGSGIETIESVRFSAPRAFEVQNRGVLASDYERILLREYPEVRAASVWGGEDNTPPVYGRVYAACQPRSSGVLSRAAKDRIEAGMRKFGVGPIRLLLVDPTYLYVAPDVTVRCDFGLTSSDPSDVAAAVAAAVAKYESVHLGSFGGKFRYSRFLDLVDGADRGIVSSAASLRVEKRFVPSTTRNNDYVLSFNMPAFRPMVGYSGALSSSGFIHDGTVCYLDDNGAGVVMTYYLSAGGARVYHSRNIGTINYATGRVALADFGVTKVVATSRELSVFMQVAPGDIAPVRNQIVLVAYASATVIDDATGLALARVKNIGTSGLTTTARESGLETVLTAF